MTIPENNVLPWGSVRGAASDYVERYPVIIQIYKGEDPVHFAQVDVKGDGSYEHKFRVRNVDLNTGEAVNIFQGEYTVKNLQSNSQYKSNSIISKECPVFSVLPKLIHTIQTRLKNLENLLS